MALLRHRQRALTSVSPHRDNPYYAVPSRSGTGLTASSVDFLNARAVAVSGTDIITGNDAGLTFDVYDSSDLTTGVTGQNVRTIVQAGYDMAGTALVSDAWTAPTSGTMFFEVVATENSSGPTRKLLYRSTNKGVSFDANPLRMGFNADDGLHYENRTFLSARSMAEIELDAGGKALVFAEYSFDSTVSNSMQVMISTDDGLTWSRLWLFNGGTQNFRHAHAIFQNPYNNKIMVCLGDQDGTTGVVQGPAVTDWSVIDNASAATIAGTANFDMSDTTQRWRWVDVLFIGGRIVACADTIISGSTGWWSAAPDLSEIFQLDDDPRFVSELHALTGMIELGNGGYVTTEFVEQGSPNPNLRTWTSRDGNRWSESGFHAGDPAVIGVTRSAHLLNLWNLPDGRLVMGGSIGRLLDGGPINRTAVVQFVNGNSQPGFQIAP